MSTATHSSTDASAMVLLVESMLAMGWYLDFSVMPFDGELRYSAEFVHGPTLRKVFATAGTMTSAITDAADKALSAEPRDRR